MIKKGVEYEIQDSIIIKKMGDQNITDSQIGKIIGNFLGISERLRGINISDYYFDYEAFGRFELQHNFSKFENDLVIILIPNKAQK